MKKRLITLALTAAIILQTLPSHSLIAYADTMEETSAPAEIVEMTEISEENIELPLEIVEENKTEVTPMAETVVEETAPVIEENTEETPAVEETVQVTEEEPVIEETQTVIEETEQTEEEVPAVEETETAEEIETVEETEENEEVSWQSYTLYNYISINNGKTYISLNTQENGISAPKSPAEFQKEHGNTRYDLNTSEYEIAGYDLTQLVLTIGGFTYVEQSVAKEGQPYFIARLDRVEAVRAANFRPSDSVQGIESFTSLDNSHITFHRNWYLTLVVPVHTSNNNKLLTGVRLGDGKNGNGDGKYYGLEYTENFTAVDSRLIPFGTKLKADQYSIADYDFTDVTLTYKGQTYAYRPNGPVAGDGENFHYYTVSFMKIDKLNKSTYGGGYLAENWPAWSLINTNAASTDGYPYLAGYYHRDYQATLMVGDAPAVIEEEPIVEEAAPIVEETVIEETATIVEEEAVIEETATTVEEETVIEETTTVEEITPVVEEIAQIMKREAIVEETAEAIEDEAVTEETVEDAAVIEAAPAVTAEIPQTTVRTVPVAPAATEAAPEVATENINEEIVPLAPVAEEEIEEMAMPLAARPAWALLNLISTICTGLISLAMIAGYFLLGDKSDDDRNRFTRVMTLVPAAAAMVMFILTENMNGRMVLTDKWTVRMLAVLLANAVAAFAARKNDRIAENDN
ncbi:MAG: hypothetical protein IJG64_05620 [Oscillospiraceae bacterium]|nr:hypothetical protein [Oscillospiraceae bacterium]